VTCDSSYGGVVAKKPSVDLVCNTLLYLLYSHARSDKEQLKLLEDCNKVFAISEKKEKARSSAIGDVNSSERLPDFADAFKAIAALLDVHIVVFLDDVDRLDKHDQHELSKRVQGILSSSKATKPGHRSIKFLVGCRSVSSFYDQNQVRVIKNLLWSIDVDEFNNGDMGIMLEDALKDVPGLTQGEKKEAVDAILKKAGSRFTYVSAIAFPFLREPFKGSLSNRLQSLPEGISSVYSDALQKMGQNYVGLLQTALLWSLLAPVPLRLGEIMDAYKGTYRKRGPHVEEEATALDDGRFPTSSPLEIEQLRGACGPFLRLELETRPDQYLVHLQDPPQIQDFCFPTSAAHSQNVDANAHLCTRCESAKIAAGTLAISPKHGHLKLALECMRVMNNAVFQRRSTSKDEKPLWNQSGLKIETSENEVVSEDSNDDLGTLKPIPTFTRQGQSIKLKPISMRYIEEARPTRKQRNIAPQRGTNAVERRTGVDPNEHKKEAHDPDLRIHRYEMEFWYYHILQAEALWPPAERSESSDWADLFDELDFWVSQNADWFRRWQLSDTTLANYQGDLDPLHVAACLGLTSWVSHLLSNGAEINATSCRVSKTALQVAADKVNSLDMLHLLLEKKADPNISINSTPACE
jgi:hypothetical protein